MKKITILLLSLCIALCLGFSLVSCNDTPDNGVSGGCVHEFGEEQIIHRATCDEKGLVRKTCKLCYESFDFELEPLEHDYEVLGEQLPTCVMDGYRDLRCRSCGTGNHEELKATGHSYVFEVATNPTEQAGGTLGYICTAENCFEGGNVDMPALTDSAYTKDVVDADTTNYTYTYEDNEIKFTISNYVVYPVWNVGNNPFKFTAYRITGYTGSSKNLTLPSTWNGGPVIQIEEHAFMNNEEIESVVIPKVSFAYTIDDINDEYKDEFLAEMGEGDADGKYYLNGYEKIEGHAFYGCTALTSVTLPDAVLEIGECAFEGCHLLESINLSSVSHIGVQAFADCSGRLTSIDLSSATYIGGYAFFNCNALEDVKLGNSLETIDSYAFKNCHALTEIVISNSVENVGGSILDNCLGLKKLTVPKLYWGKLASLFSGNLNGSFETGSYYDINPIDVPALECVTVTQQTEIPDGAFSECSGIKKIVLPSNTESIGKQAFSGCYSLEEFVFPDTVKSVGNNAFEGVNAYNFTQDFDNKAYYIGSETNQYFYLLTVDNVASGDVYIQDGCKLVANRVFDACTDEVTAIHIPSSVEYLGMIKYATGYGSGSELDIYFDGTVERFTELGFVCGGWNFLYLYVPNGQNGWSEVTELVISDKVTEIQTGIYTTYGSFPNFESVRIPKTVTAFGTSAFRYSAIETVYYEGTLDDWCRIDFANDKSNPMSVATNFYLLDDSTNWAQATEITLSENATMLKSHALLGFDGLAKLVIPSNVVSVNYSAYGYCENLSAIYFEGTQAEWETVCNSSSSSDTTTKYFYSETQPTLEEYLDGKDLTLWHYNDSDEAELWSAKRGTSAYGKTYAYISSGAQVSEDYWQMILALKANDMVEAVEDPDLIAMINRSETKADFENELAVYYASTGEGLVLTFENGEVLLEQKGESTTLGYLELDGKIYYTLTGGLAFIIVDDGNGLKEEIVTEYFTITHNYSIVNE